MFRGLIIDWSLGNKLKKYFIISVKYKNSKVEFIIIILTYVRIFYF